MSSIGMVLCSMINSGNRIVFEQIRFLQMASSPVRLAQEQCEHLQQCIETTTSYFQISVEFFGLYRIRSKQIQYH